MLEVAAERTRFGYRPLGALGPAVRHKQRKRVAQTHLRPHLKPIRAVVPAVAGLHARDTLALRRVFQTLNVVADGPASVWRSKATLRSQELASAACWISWREGGQLPEPFDSRQGPEIQAVSTQGARHICWQQQEVQESGLSS